MTKKKQSRKEEAEKHKSEEIEHKKLSKEEEFLQKIFSKKDDVTKKTPSRKEEPERVTEPSAAKEKEIIEESFGKMEGVAEKPAVKKEEPEKAAEPSAPKEKEIIEESFGKKKAEEGPLVKKEEPEKVAGGPAKQIGGAGAETKKRLEVNKLLGNFTKSVEERFKGLGKIKVAIPKTPGRKEEVAEKAPGKKEEAEQKIAEPIVTTGEIEGLIKKEEATKIDEHKVIEEKAAVNVAEPVVASGEQAAHKEPGNKEEAAKEAAREKSEMKDIMKKCSEIKKLHDNVTKSLAASSKMVGRIKGRDYTANITKFESAEKELYDKLENSSNNVRTELDELHKILQKYEERVRYKDEAEGELQSLEEVKMLLWDKLGNISRRIRKLKVRPKSDLIKLFAEAKECEDEVKRSDEDILDFEREYTKFLSMMGKISG
jgi:hypothetical protein